MALGNNISKLVSSKVAIFVTAFFTAPILARLFTPGSFGVRQIFMSIAGIIAVVASLRYELSIPLVKDEKKAGASFVLSLFLAFLSSLAVLVLVWVLGGKTAQWFKAPELEGFLWLLPIAVLIASLATLLRYWAARKQKFGAVALSNLGSSLGGRVSSIVWGVVIGSSATGLFVGYFAGITLCVSLLLIFLGRTLMLNLKEAHINMEQLCTVAKRHKKFPIFSTWSGLLNMISIQLPPIVLGLYFSVTVVGYYSFGYALITLPAQLVGSSIAEVFFPVAAKEHREMGSLSEIVSKVFERLVQIGVFPLVTMGLLAPSLFGFLLGREWIEAGVYAQILSPWLVLFFITSPLSPVFDILNRQGTNLFLNVVTILGRVAGLLLGASILLSPRWALVLFTGFSVFIVTVRLTWILRLSSVSALWTLRKALMYLAISFALVLPIRGISPIVEDSTVMVLAVLATAAYATVLLLVEPSFKRFILANLTGFKRLRTLRR